MSAKGTAAFRERLVLRHTTLAVRRGAVALEGEVSELASNEVEIGAGARRTEIAAVTEQSHGRHCRKERWRECRQ